MDPFIHSHFHSQVNPSHNDDVPLVIIIYEYPFVSSTERSTYIFSNFLVSTVINLHMVKVNAKFLYFLLVQVPHLHLSLHFVKSDDSGGFHSTVHQYRKPKFLHSLFSLVSLYSIWSQERKNNTMIKNVFLDVFLYEREREKKRATILRLN